MGRAVPAGSAGLRHVSDKPRGFRGLTEAGQLPLAQPATFAPGGAAGWDERSREGGGRAAWVGAAPLGLSGGAARRRRWAV